MYIWVVNIIPTWKLLGTTFIVQYVATEQWIGSSKWNSDARLAVLRGIHDLSMEDGLEKNGNFWMVKNGEKWWKMVKNGSFTRVSHAEIVIHDVECGFIWFKTGFQSRDEWWLMELCSGVI